MTDNITDTVNAPALKVHISLGPKANSLQAMEAIDAICVALSRQEASAQHLRILLGRTLAAIQEKRLYEPDHATFEEFTLAVAEKHRLSRTTVRESLMIAKNLPMLDMRQAEEMPMLNIALAARAAKKASPREMPGIIKAATRTTVIEFRQKMEERGLIAHRGRPEGEKSDTVTLHIKVKPAVADRWREIVANEDPGAVLADMIMPKRAARRKAA